MKNAKIAVYSVEVETVQTENKGTVLIENSDQLLNYNRSEEIAMEKVRKLTASTVDGCGAVLNGVVPRAFMQMIKSIVDSGANVIITGSKFSEMATHYCERYGVLMLKVSSCHPVSVTRLLIQRLTPTDSFEVRNPPDMSNRWCYLLGQARPVRSVGAGQLQLHQRRDARRYAGDCVQAG